MQPVPAKLGMEATGHCTHPAAPTWDPTVPRGQTVHDAAPPVLNWPAEQVLQEAEPVWGWNWPAGHEEQKVDPAWKEKVPGEQAMQDVLPLTEAKRPGAQGVQLADPVASAKVPTGHALQEPEPAGDVVPAGQDVQIVPPEIGLKEPALQASQVADPFSETNPAAQALQAFDPSVELVPAGQGWKVSSPGQKFPAAQGEHPLVSRNSPPVHLAAEAGPARKPESARRIATTPERNTIRTPLGLRHGLCPNLVAPGGFHPDLGKRG